MKTLVIDPNSGWRYGFPKPYHNPDNLSLNEWLVANGYPQERVDYWMGSSLGYVPCRYWSYECQTNEELEEAMKEHGVL